MSSPTIAIDHIANVSLAELLAATVVDERRATVITTALPPGSFAGWGPRLPR